MSSQARTSTRRCELVKIDETKSIVRLLAKVRAQTPSDTLAGESIVAVGAVQGSAYTYTLVAGAAIGAVQRSAYAAIGGGVISALIERMSKGKQAKAEQERPGSLAFSKASHVVITDTRLILLSRAGKAFTVVDAAPLREIIGIEASMPRVPANSTDGRITFSLRNAASHKLSMTPGQAHTLVQAWQSACVPA
jgi:hypothetical protein